MNAPLTTRDDGVTFQQTHTDPEIWNVIVDGQQGGWVQKDDGKFVGYTAGHRSPRSELIQRPIDWIAERCRERWVIEARWALEDQAKQETAVASLMAMTPRQIENAIELLEDRRARLPYSAGSKTDVPAIDAQLGRQVASLRDRLRKAA